MVEAVFVKCGPGTILFHLLLSLVFQVFFHEKSAEYPGAAARPYFLAVAGCSFVRLIGLSSRNVEPVPRYHTLPDGF